MEQSGLSVLRELNRADVELLSTITPYGALRHYTKIVDVSRAAPVARFLAEGYIVADLSHHELNSTARQRKNTLDLARAGFLVHIDRSRSHHQRVLVGAIVERRRVFASWLAACARESHATVWGMRPE